MNFSAALKELLKISDTKMKDLAEYLSYDLSYISKWANDKLLPNHKVYIDVISKMSKYISRRVYFLGRQDQVVNMSERPFIIESSYQLESLIYSILEYGYFTSEFAREELVGENIERAYLNQERKTIVDNIVREIKIAIYSAKEDVEIYCSSSNFYFIKDILSRFKSFYIVNNIRVVMKLMTTEENMDAIFYDSKLREQIYNLVGNLIFFDLEIHQEFINPYSGFVFIKGQFLINYSVGDDGQPNCMVFSQKNSLVEEQFSICQKLFSKKTLTMTSSDKLDFENLVIGFYMSPENSKVTIYSSFLEAVYIENKFLERLMKKNKVSAFEANMVEWIKKAYLNIKESKELVINLSIKGIRNSLARKELVIGDLVLKLTAEEYKEYIEGFKKILREDKNIKVYLFEDRDFPIRVNDFGMSIFLSNNYSYIKKNPKLVDDRINGYFELVDKDYSEKFFNLSEELSTKINYRELKEADIDEYITLLEWNEE